MPELPHDLALRRIQADTFVDLARIHRTIDRRVAQLFEEVGLQEVTPAQATVLQTLVTARKPLTARQVAHHLALSEVTVGRFVRSLEANGWLKRERDPSDSRAMLLKPTERTYRELPHFLVVSNGLLDEAFAGMTPEAITALGVQLSRVQANLQCESSAKSD